MLAVGLMSGTSLDGIDAALVNIEGYGLDTKVNLVEFENYNIPDDIKSEIKRACLDDESSVDLICSLNFKLGELFADAVINICNKAMVDIKELDYIASHGQTIYHIPRSRGDLVKIYFANRRSKYHCI